MEWADARQWTAVLDSEQARTDEKVKDYLFHLHMVQRAFLKVWRNEVREPAFPKFNDIREIAEWARSYYAEIFDHLSAVPADTFGEQCNLPWAGMVEKQLGYPPSGTTVCETVLQVVLHSTYHRGQINARLKEVGGSPPLLDYIAWLWMGKPAPDWPN